MPLTTGAGDIAVGGDGQRARAGVARINAVVLPLTVVPAPVVTLRVGAGASSARRCRYQLVPVTLPLAVMVSAPVPKLRAEMPSVPPLTVVPAPVVTVRAVP